MAERGMGRGLAAILSVSREEEGAGAELRQLPVDLIAPNPRQPRRHFDEEALGALADSVRERGVLQPVLVRPVAGGTYELIAGERRWRAARAAGLAEVPALVSPRDDAEALEVALVENMAREDLNPVEEARACAALVEELGLTREDVGRRVGRALLLAADHEARRRLARDAVAGEWSVRTLEARARAAGERPKPGTSPRTSGVHPDQAAAASSIADSLSAVLGTEVRVRPAADGYRAEISFADPAEALALARRIGPRRVA